MFHSETLARIIHADRVRDLERAARDRRLLAGTTDEGPAIGSTTLARPTPAARRTACGDSANLPA